MILPSINLQNKIDKNSFYFGCDSNYFNLYGKSLANSLKYFAPWANVHVHLFNPSNDDISWCNMANLTYSFETFPVDFKEIKTYYACVRFVRIPEIFSNNARIIALDCDGIAMQEINETRFLKDTEVSAVLWREKQQTSLASSICFGEDDFRNLFSSSLIPYFENDSAEWFLDQNILDKLINEDRVKTIMNRDWGSPKVGKDTLIWTAKGDKKNKPQFQELLVFYKNLQWAH